MKMNKNLFGILFLLTSAVALLVLNYYGVLEKYVHFALIPILSSYFLGQYAQRKYGYEDRKSH